MGIGATCMTSGVRNGAISRARSSRRGGSVEKGEPRNGGNRSGFVVTR